MAALNTTLVLVAEAYERFQRINDRYFDPPVLPCMIRFSPRLRRSGGSTKPGLIVLSLAHHKAYGWREMERSLKHEMLHRWMATFHPKWNRHNHPMWREHLKRIGGKRYVRRLAGR